MRPNFLFIVADDLNSWIGALGRNPDVRTPHIDALSRRGTLFTNTYCSAPYCNASRMGMFTGCLPSTTGVYHNEPLWDTPDRRLTFVELLRSAGYYTFGAGKVFHGVFDYATAGRDKLTHAAWREIENRSYLWDAFSPNRSEPLPSGRPLNKLFDFGNFEAVPPMYHLFDWGPLPEHHAEDMPDAQVFRSVSKFLNEAPQEPFFCAAGFYKPHLPWHVPKRFFDLYDVERITLPLVKTDDLDDVPPIPRKWALTPPDHELVTSHNQWRPAVQAYLASISYVDHLIGGLIETLEKSGHMSDTVIILCGDNGFHLGEKLHWRKFVLWEEATRVPLIVVPPNNLRGSQRICEPASLIDLFPTILELAGIDAAPDNDGQSLVQWLQTGSGERSTPVVMTWGKGNHSIRTIRWRYTRYSDGTNELYDHAADPHEWTNLAGDSILGDACRQLEAALPTDIG
jgi:arylsulfatase A-like enzyme